MNNLLTDKMNKASKLRLVMLSLLFFMALTAYAQKITIQWVEVSGDKIIVHYNLDDTNPNHEYTISLLSSKDNFGSPLTKVSGDVGNEVKPGLDKKIIWDITKELGNYKGEIELEVKGKFFLPFLKLTNFDTEKKYKRGKSYPLVWTSGNLSGQIDIELYNGKDRVSREANVANTGKYDWFVPGHVKPGSDYMLKFTNVKNREEVIYSETFRVAPKIPMAVKIGGIAIVGGAIAFLAGGSGGGDTVSPPAGPTSLDDPPAVPD